MHGPINIKLSYSFNSLASFEIFRRAWPWRQLFQGTHISFVITQVFSVCVCVCLFLISLLDYYCFQKNTVESVTVGINFFSLVFLFLHRLEYKHNEWAYLLFSVYAIYINIFQQMDI